MPTISSVISKQFVALPDDGATVCHRKLENKQLSGILQLPCLT